MVKLKNLGGGFFDWIATRYKPKGEYDISCLTAFSEDCFEDAYEINDQTMYTVELDTLYQSKKTR